ncbi:MAG: hypothetical protein KKC68_03090 [Candidatus Thermoplasmatota archaeon]|nr:hypothetical protein [Candidatus Thermoplasmatota archaeon]MBU1940739.1 hypothetical protein [Candidatus Thermoplasmatota archaeon]
MNTPHLEQHSWLDEAKRFIEYWEQATEEIRSRALNPKECSVISELFHQDSDGLLLRRPVEISDEQIVTRLDQLDNKLNTSLAMVCSVHQKIDE